MAPYYAAKDTETVSERVVLLLGRDPRMNVVGLLDDGL